MFKASFIFVQENFGIGEEIEISLLNLPLGIAKNRVFDERSVKSCRVEKGGQSS